MGLAGCQIQVSFFSITNTDGRLYAKFDVIRPKRVLCENKVIKLLKLSEYSKSLENGLFVGIKQHKRDSLYVPKNSTKIWLNGHVGYFNMFDTLLVEDEKIREIINVDNDWDGEWEQDEILDSLTEEQIQQKIDEYNNDPWIKYYSIMEKLWTDFSETKQFKQKCEKLRIPNETFNYYVKNKEEHLCTDCGTENSSMWSNVTDPTDLNKKRTICFNCSTKYKQLYLHPLNKKINESFPGALVVTSNILKTKEDKGKNREEVGIHVCADIEKINGENIWVIYKTKTQTVEIDDKLYPLTVKN